MMLSQLSLDRNSEVSLFRQLRAAIEMAIIDGELPDGTALPSVRNAALLLNVAPITVVQAYKALQVEGLLRSVPKRGYFVTVHPRSHRLSEGLVRVNHLIDQALDAAVDADIDEAEFARIAVERARLRKSGKRTVAVFGYREASLQDRVKTTQAFVADLNVDVIGISFEEIEALGLGERDANLRSIDLFLVSVGEVDKAAGFLKERSARILPMTRVLRSDVVRFVEDQPGTARFGVIAGSLEFAERIIAVLRRMRSLMDSPLTAVVTDSDQVQHVLSEADAVLIGSVAAPKINIELPSELPAMEFVSLPDTVTLTKLRRHLIPVPDDDEVRL